MEKRKRQDRGSQNGSLAALIREGALEEELLPYEKFERVGAETLTDAELLAVIIRTGSGSRTPMEIGCQILQATGTGESGLANLNHLSLSDLRQISGIGPVKAVKLKCIAELSRRMAAERARPTLKFSDAGSIAGYYMERLRHEERERVMLLSLSSRMCLIAESTISIGSVDRSILSTREVYQEAVRMGAVNIVVLHNHPGGDPSPSKEDYQSTEALMEAGKLMQIRLADHLIIGDNSYFSFRESGYL